MVRPATPELVTDEGETPDFAPLTPESIAAQTDAGSFKRGQTYFRGKRIFAAYRRENLLRARCRGSSGGPYVVEATLATTGQKKKRNPATYACTCPRGGFCKHVVALLLTWLERPETFDVRPPLAESLAGKSQEELVALIARMLQADPELEEFLDLPILVPGAASPGAVDEAALHRQIVAALKEHDSYGYGGYSGYGRYGRYGYEEYGASRVAAKLERVLAAADSYANAGDWANALRVAALLVEEVAPRLASIADDDGEIYSLLSRADALLAAALDAQEELPAAQRLSPEERTRLIDTSLSVWQADFDLGGVDLAQEGPEAIARAASADEQRRVGERLRQALQATTSAGAWNRTWQRPEIIGFLSLLAGDAGLSDEELLTEYRNAELWEEAADLLLQMERVDEALSLAKRRLAGANALVPFADRLVATGDAQRIAQAIALVDDRLWEQEGQNVRDDQALREWLQRQYGAHGNPEKALALARERFRIAPAKETYDAVKAAAHLPGQPGDPWPALRQELVATLRKLGGWYALIDLNLEEGEVAAALQALRDSEKPRRGAQVAWGYGWGASSDTYALRVAAAAEAAFPDESIRIYRSMANQLIDARGRGNYQVAASHLVRVMNLMERSGRGDEWASLISDLRERNRSLRALREELDVLGLT